MKRETRVDKILLSTVLGMIVLTSCASAFASDRSRESNRGRDNNHGRDFGRTKKHEVVVVGRERYNYHDGRFYRPGFFGFEFLLSSPPFGAVVMSLPIGHNTLTIGASRYYHYNNVYYKPVPSGYIVVPQPPVVVSPAPIVLAPQQVQGEIVTVNVPNLNGSYTAITLVRRNNGYIGPQGEYYPDHPSVDQLRALYGR